MLIVNGYPIMADVLALMGIWVTERRPIANKETALAEMSDNVRDNKDRSRFELDTTAGLAIADYRLAGNVMVIYYTQVPLALRGRGIGSHLVRGALQQARRLNVKVDPQCQFVREVIEREPAFQDLLKLP